MKPITLKVKETHQSAPSVLAERILNPGRDRNFVGQDESPGILSATVEQRPAEVIGTRTRVTTDEGTSYIEEIVEWEPDKRVSVEVKEFSDSMASARFRFIESWEFERIDDKTKVIRSLTAFDA